MQFGISNKKAGVSLVTVLLFMLVATIAATATYKWLTSEGRSSGSRMQKQMAYQSAIAGIENARAWMTFHANDVGALVKQYMEGNYVPINLDANLRSLQRPGQNHHVWLVGVNAPTSGSTYKLKVLSSGEASGGARHSEVAIFNVSGLYQVSLPVQEHPKKKIPFDYAYFGGSYDGAGSLTMTSAIVNGNWYGNPQGIEKKFVVTGNANLTGNDVRIGELACVGGNMSPENQGLQGKDIYVGKSFTGNMGHLTGSAYFNGDVTPSSAGNFIIDKHVTLNGNLQTVQSAKRMTISGNLCLDEDAHILSKGSNYAFESKGDVWMPGTNNIWYGSIKYSGCTCERVWCAWSGCTPKTVVPCTGGGKKQEAYGWTWGEATYTLISCADTNLIADGDNYNKADSIILGGNGNKVYIKTAYSWDEYNGENGLVERKTFEEINGKTIKCNARPGVMAPAGHGYCNNSHENGTMVGPGERWTGTNDEPIYKTYTPKQSANKLYYSYYMPSGHTDVELKDFVDEYWYWCKNWQTNYWGSLYCADESLSGTTLLAYHVDGKRFWDGNESHDRNRLNYKDGKPTGSPYCTNRSGVMGPGHERDKFRPTCGVTPWFVSNGNVSRNFPQTKIECAEAVKDSCDSIWVKKPGCDGSSYKVDDVLVTAKAMFEPYASKGCAANITRYSGDLVTKLNNCYKQNSEDPELSEKNLYNGYLVVKVSGGTNSTNPAGTLKGKFIIIAKDALYTKLPQTEDGTFVLLYLEKGANTLNDVTVSNYFIYTEGNIGSGNQFNLNGTIYATAESCAGLGKLQSSSITYNQNLVNELSAAGVICPNDGTVCGGKSTAGGSGSDPAASGSGEEEEEITTTSGTDAYYISMAPQLGVTLESQYENNEPLPSGENQTNLAPSFIVLPRVIYLPSDPFGELQDYYNVIPLNGSTLKKTDVSVSSCVGASGSISASGKLYTGTALSKGIYTCNAKANAYNDVPFWVVIGDEHRTSLPITFIETDQKIAANQTKTVSVMIPPNTPSVTLRVSCPAWDTHWHYTLGSSGTRDDDAGICSFPVQGDPSAGKSVELFAVTTDADATTGSITFQLLSGDDYSIGHPYTSTVYMASSAEIRRDEVETSDITTYCSAHPSNCPPADERDNWPSCNTNETWVEPAGIVYGTEEKNNSWNIVVGGSGTLQLVGHDVANCVAIVADQTKEIADIEAGETVYLRASLKALKRTVKIEFVGEITDEPEITITGGSPTTCKYDKIAEEKSCYISTYSGQQVSLSIDKDTYPKFNYWQCSGASCPVTNAVGSETYNPFTVNDDNTVIYAHFNESDKHCFFDQFKSGTVQCSSTQLEYCIDKCGSADEATCVGAIDANGKYTKSKWHLISGELGDIDVFAGYISLHRQGRDAANPVTVLSTVNAGTYGTLKALFQVPKETQSHNRNSTGISRSGFLLHSNVTGSEYLMLNVFAGQSGYLEAQLCSNNGRCLSETFVDATSSHNPVSVYSSSMIMMSATIGVNGKLSITAFDKFYGEPTAYGVEFNLEGVGTSYMDAAHDFVGFSLADPNMKLYGVGWKSETYSADCFDTPPVVKCSFAAVAVDGVIPTETENPVEPWIGHTGWFDDKEYSCTKKYYYYNGADACSGSLGGVAVCPGGYTFSESGAGPHGYKNNDGTDEKTAKAWLDCYLSNPTDNAWTVESEAGRAHCGPFWTGTVHECSAHSSVADAEGKPISANLETSFALAEGEKNLRATTLAIELLNPDDTPASGVDVEVWLISTNSDWSSPWGSQGYPSKSVYMTTGKASFSVDETMSVGTEGFDPENVTNIVFHNRGSNNLKVKSVVASCKNAVDINACEATYGDGKWTIKVDVENKDDIASYGVEAKVDDATVFDVTKLSSEVSWEGDKAILEQADNPYAEYQGKSYVFSASIVNQMGAIASKECNTVTIGSITSSCDVAVSSKKQGEGLPQFNVGLGVCPAGGCQYEIYIGSSMVQEGTTAAGNVTINVTPDGNGSIPSGQTQATTDYAVGTYTYTVKSPVGATYPFADCSKTFEITEKSNTNTEAKTECWFASSNIQPGANANFKAYVNSHGYNICNRAYELRNSSGTKVAEGTSTGCNSELSFDINGTKTLVSDNFKLYVKEGDSFVSVCYADASLTVKELSPSCSIQNDNGKNYFYVSFTGSICASSNYCSYNVKRTYNGTTTSITGGNVGLSQNSFRAGEMTGFGNYVLWLNDKETTCAVNVEEPDPAFTCPANLTAIAGKTNNVTITPSSVSGCDNGCSYTIAGTSVTSNAFEYHFGALPTFTNSTTAAGNTATYEVSLTNNKTTVKHNCEVTFVEESVTPVDNPGQVACYMDQYYDWGQGSMKLKFDNYNGAYSNKAYEVKDASNETRASGNSTGSSQTIEIALNGYATDSKLTLTVAGSEVCSITPGVIKPYLKDCKFENGKLHFQIEKCQNNQCSYQVKTASGTDVGTEQTGKGSGGYDVSVTDNGMYVIWLNGEETSCRIPKNVSMSTPVNCYYPQYYDWGTNNMQFKIDNTGNIMNGKNYTVKNSAGTTVASGTGGNSGTIDINLNSSAYANGTPISVYVGTALYCSAIPSTYGPVLRECKLDNYTISSGSSTTFRYTIDKCKNKQCPYQVKRGSTVVFDSDDDSNEPQEGGKTLSVSTAGTYVIWMNGKETGCRATLNVQ